jgi:hypothetical protein
MKYQKLKNRKIKFLHQITSIFINLNHYFQQVTKKYFKGVFLSAMIFFKCMQFGQIGAVQPGPKNSPIFSGRFLVIHSVGNTVRYIYVNSEASISER